MILNFEFDLLSLPNKTWLISKKMYLLKSIKTTKPMLRRTATVVIPTDNGTICCVSAQNCNFFLIKQVYVNNNIIVKFFKEYI